MKGLKNIKALVKAILQADPMARNSDSYLYFRVLQTIARERNIDLDKVTVLAFLCNMNNYPFPPFESVRRSRQKVQAEFPYLGACEKVSEYRAENEEEFRDFARS